MATIAFAASLSVACATSRSEQNQADDAKYLHVERDESCHDKPRRRTCSVSREYGVKEEVFVPMRQCECVDYGSHYCLRIFEVNLDQPTFCAVFWDGAPQFRYLWNRSLERVREDAADADDPRSWSRPNRDGAR